MREADVTVTASAATARRAGENMTPRRRTRRLRRKRAAVGAGRVDPEAALVANPPGGAGRARAAGGHLRRPRVPAGHPHHRQRAGRRGSDAGWLWRRRVSYSTPSRASPASGPGSTASPPTPPIRSCGGGDKKNEVSWEALFPSLTSWAIASIRGQRLVGQGRGARAAEESSGRCCAAWATYPDDYRTAFLMHDVEGLSNPEIAESLGISLPAVKSRVHRSRLFLRQRLRAISTRPDRAAAGADP